jgi:hypothetical protein
VTALAYTQTAQLYLHATVTLSLFSLVIMVSSALYVTVSKFNDDQPTAANLFVPNLLLALNLAVQGILMLVTTFMLA